MSISIHELLAVARESEGVCAVKGDTMLCDKRFDRETSYMVEFTVLKEQEGAGTLGAYYRCFLTGEGYREIQKKERKKEIRVQRLALVIEGELHYIPPPAVARDGEKDH